MSAISQGFVCLCKSAVSMSVVATNCHLTLLAHFLEARTVRAHFFSAANCVSQAALSIASPRVDTQAP